MIIKICGLTDTQVVSRLSSLDVDLMGIVCVPSSPRFMSVTQAQQLATAKPPLLKLVLVFQDQSVEEINSYLSVIKPDYIQLHGQESPDFCASLAVPIIKTLRLQADFDRTHQMAKKYASVPQHFLIDRPQQGNGPLADIVQVNKLSALYSIILAGGLTPTNINQVLDNTSHSLMGVDVSGGVEIEPSKKDFKLIKQFIAKVRSHHVSH